MPSICMESRVVYKQAVEKVIFSQIRSGANKSKILSTGLLKQTGLFLKNNKPKPFDGIIKEICHPLLADKPCNL